jgi:hypothetical protein
MLFLSKKFRMAFILAIFGLLTLIAIIRKGLRSSSEVVRSEKAVLALQHNPEQARELIAKAVHKCWYVNVDQIPQWDAAIRSMPATFRIGGFANVNYWQIHNSNELIMVVVCEYVEMGVGGNVSRASYMKEKMHLTAHVRPNLQSGDYEMRVRLPVDNDEKRAMSTFGRKFFDALKERV